MDAVLSYLVISSAALVALVAFYLGRRSSRYAGMQDFDVARRTVRSRRNATAMAGEYLCAAAFLGIAGAVLADGADALWYPIGFVVGYLILTIFVAAPLRRSGAYTLPDFVQERLDSTRLRALASVVVVLIAVLYVVPQLQGAGLVVTTLMAVPSWSGPVAVTVVVLVIVLGGGMRAMTVAQAFHYWLKLFAIAAPTLVLFAVFLGRGRGQVASGSGGEMNAGWLVPGGDLLGTYSLLIALGLGAMGLPHVLVRFYTNPDGAAARRSTVNVTLLLGVFYLFPTMLGALSKLYVPELVADGEADAAVLLLPSAMLPGVAGEIVIAVLVAGAFSAFLAASCGLVYSVAGVLSTDVLPGRVRDFRLAAVLIALVPLGLALAPREPDLAHSIGIAFALAASTFGPVVLLGIWWRGLTAKGAAAAMVIGGGLVLAALVTDIVSSYHGDWAPTLVQRPALVSVVAAFLAALLVSGLSRATRPAGVNAAMLRMHAPDRLGFVSDPALPRYGQVDGTGQPPPGPTGKHRA